MTNSQGAADKALALTFDTVTNAQKMAGDIALTISDTYRLKPFVFWGVVATAVAAVVAAVAIARR